MIEVTSRNIRTLSRLGACGAFGLAALDFPELDNNIVVLTSDLCFFSGLERFKAAYPDRIYNVGIAEQNMIGVAGGFAKEGFIPFATTYATFASMRCADQIRVNMGYMRLPIKLIGLTAGLSVGILGPTHMSIEDIAVIRAIPHIVILSPADSLETIKAVQASVLIDGPVYIRLTGSSNLPAVYSMDYPFEVGKAIRLKTSPSGENTVVSIIATGSMVYPALQAAEELESEGISCDVINMHTIRPLDEDAVVSAAHRRLLVTVEEHSIQGGMGSAVNDFLVENQLHPRRLTIGIPHEYPHAGEYGYLLEQCGLTPSGIAGKIREAFKTEES